VTAPRDASALLSPAEGDSGSNSMPGARKIPIGVFDPVFNHLSLDQMIEKISALGIEAVEMGTGGYPGTPHCPVQELLTDNAKLHAWKKKFEDRNIQVAVLSCHGNPVHPDPKIAERDAEIFRRTVQLAERLGVDVIVGFSGCPGGNASDTMPNWATIAGLRNMRRFSIGSGRKRVIPYWKQAAKSRATMECTNWHSRCTPVSWCTTDDAAKAPRSSRRGARRHCDLSHLFWQGCDPLEVIRLLAKNNALFHAHMKDTVMFKDNVAKYGVLNFAFDTKDLAQASETFRAVGYGHSANTWKEIVRTYMEVGYQGILSIENEDPILPGEVGVERAMYVLKNVRSELLGAA